VYTIFIWINYNIIYRKKNYNIKTGSIFVFTKNKTIELDFHQRSNITHFTAIPISLRQSSRQLLYRFIIPLHNFNHRYIPLDLGYCVIFNLRLLLFRLRATFMVTRAHLTVNTEEASARCSFTGLFPDLDPR